MLSLLVGLLLIFIFILFARSIVAHAKQIESVGTESALRPRRFICEINGRN